MSWQPGSFSRLLSNLSGDWLIIQFPPLTDQEVFLSTPAAWCANGVFAATLLACSPPSLCCPVHAV